jgi:hypothetical protein
MEGARRSQDVFPMSDLASGALFAAPEGREPSVRLHLKVPTCPPVCHFAPNFDSRVSRPSRCGTAVVCDRPERQDGPPARQPRRAPTPAIPPPPLRLAGREKILLDERVEVAIEHGFDVPHL